MLTATSAAGTDNVLYLGNNVHRDTDDSLEYIHGDEASLYSQQNGTHTFFVAGSGSAGDNISFTNAMVINNSGNIGIGTASPISSGVETSLHIYGNHNSNNTILVVEQDGGSSSALINIDSASGRDSYIQFQEAGTTKASVFNDASADSLVLTDGANSNTVFIKSDSVGINVSPATKLHVKGSGEILRIENDTNASGNTYMSFHDTSAVKGYLGYTGGSTDHLNIWNVENAHVKIATNNTERITVLGGGNVGIGDTSPDNKLSIYGGDKQIRMGTSDANHVVIGRNSSTGNFEMARTCTNAAEEVFFRAAEHEAGALTFFTSEVARFIIDGNSRISLSNNDNNSQNTVFGQSAFNAGSDNGSDNNTAIGHLSMGTGTVSGALNNTAVGYLSLEDLTGGDQNTALGVNSLKAITTGSGNVGIGFDAGQATIDSDYGVYIGWGAGASGDIANDGQIGIGYKSLYSLISGSGNLALGFNSLTACTTGSQNVAIGESALIATDDGVGNVAIGHSSMAAGNVGNYNVGVGGQTLVDVTGSSNIAMGFQALFDITSGSKNIAIGHTALKTANGTENDNIAIGYNAMGAFDENGNGGDDNIAIGRDALKSGAMSDNTRYNIAIGNYALDATGTNHPEENVAIGHNSLGASTSGERNTAIGYNSGDVITTGTNNVIIGNLADPSANSASNQIVIGQGATGQADNSVTLGNSDVTAVYMAQDSGATIYANGINFPDDAATDHSADVNTLDNYEEGTWSPAICELADVNDVMTMNGEQAGTYVKIGRLVHLSINAGVSANGSANNSDMAIKNIPFACGGSGTTDRGFRATFNVSSAGGLNLGSGERLVGFLNAATQLIELRKVGADGNTSQVSRDELSSDGGFVMSGTYIS